MPIFEHDFKLIHKDNGNVVVPVKSTRRDYAAGSVVTLCIAIYYLVSGELDGSLLLKRTVIGSAVVFALWSAWQAILSGPVEFDVSRKRVIHGSDRSILFSHIQCIEISRAVEDSETNEYTYPLMLRLAGGRGIRLGKSKDQMESSEMAAEIATLVGKPVKNVGGWGN